MSKVGGALPSWYWPPGVPRRVPVAQQPLDRLLRQRFAKSQNEPALLSANVALSYGELLARVQQMAGGLQALEPAGPIAVGETLAIDNLTLFLGGLLAGRPVFLADASIDGDAIAAQLAEAKVMMILTAGHPRAELEKSGIRIVATDDLKGSFNEAGGGKRATEPVAFLRSRRGVVVHSHFSLSAMAASLAAFIAKLRQTPFLCTSSALGSWETLAPIVLALLNAMPVGFATVQELNEGVDLAAAAGGYMILERCAADEILRTRRVPLAITGAPYVFVSTGQFTPKWRRRFETLCRRPIFPVWGLAELGPVVAPHPTWLPLHGHGFPLVNVSLVPIDPGTGKISIVPWELLEQAEVGVETLSAMVGYTQRASNLAARVGTAVRTREMASMDHVGVVVLHGPAAAVEEARAN